MKFLKRQPKPDVLKSTVAFNICYECGATRPTGDFKHSEAQVTGPKGNKPAGRWWQRKETQSAIQYRCLPPPQECCLYGAAANSGASQDNINGGKSKQLLQIRNLDPSFDKCLGTLSGHIAAVFSVAFAPDGHHLVSGSADKTLRFWDVSTGALSRAVHYHIDSVRNIATSRHSNVIASAGADQTIRLWSLTDPLSKVTPTTILVKSAVLSVAFSPDGHFLAYGSDDNVLRIYDLKAGGLVDTLLVHDGVVSSVAFSPDGEYLASASHDMTIHVWKLERGLSWSVHSRDVLTKHRGAVHAVAFSPDSKYLASGSADKDVIVWNLQAMSSRIFTGHKGFVWSVAYSPSGYRLASASADRTIAIWDVTTNQRLQILNGHNDAIYSVSFSSNGARIVSGSGDKTVRLWGNKSDRLAVKLQLPIQQEKQYQPSQGLTSNINSLTTLAYTTSTPVDMKSGHIAKEGITKAPPLIASMPIKLETTLSESLVTTAAQSKQAFVNLLAVSLIESSLDAVRTSHETPTQVQGADNKTTIAPSSSTDSATSSQILPQAHSQRTVPKSLATSPKPTQVRELASYFPNKYFYVENIPLWTQLQDSNSLRPPQGSPRDRPAASDTNSSQKKSHKSSPPPSVSSRQERKKCYKCLGYLDGETPSEMCRC